MIAWSLVKVYGKNQGTDEPTIPNTSPVKAPTIMSDCNSIRAWIEMNIAFRKFPKERRPKQKTSLKKGEKAIFANRCIRL